MAFVVIEGPNGSGKTSLIKALGDSGYKTLSSPNGTPLAKMLRPACRGTEPWVDIDPTIQFMLFSAARFDEYLRLVHGSSDVVIADRWWTSTYVYQCCFQGIPVPFMQYTIHPNEKIDKVIILDGEDDVLIARVEGERAQNEQHGKCSWTKNYDTTKKIANLYRHELPAYLAGRNIPTEIIDTTNRTPGNVFDLVKCHIREIQNGPTNNN